MENPSQNDSASSASASDSPSTEAKKTTRQPRAKRATGAKAAPKKTAAKPRATKARVDPQQTTFDDSARAPALKETPAQPKPSAAKKLDVFVPAAKPSAPRDDRNDSREVSSDSPSQGDDRSGPRDVSSKESNGDESRLESTEDRDGQGRSGDRGSRRDRQPSDRAHGGNSNGGNQDQGRGDWKRNKRKRGRGQGAWQPGQGGSGGGSGGGGGRNVPQHPAQPAPAPMVMVQGDLPQPRRFADLVVLDALATEIASGGGDALYLDEVYAMPLAELMAFARQYGAIFEGAPNRIQLLKQIFVKAVEAKKPIRDRGYIDINAQGAFIVHVHVNYRLYPEDSYLSEVLINRYGLKRGHQVEVQVQAPLDNDRCPAAVKIVSVMGMAPDEISKITPFEELIPYYPLQRILLEAPEVQKDVSMRAVDILTPIGFGQRGLIVAPPRTGKTILLQNIANSVSENFPDSTLILLLIDERPEEVTDFKRHTKGEVVSSTFDETPESHVHCAEMVGEKARRLVEQGQHVVVLLDSITRLARAYNALTGNSGKIMSGGMEATALQKPKRFFGAARNIEGAGSLTIIGTALVDTGSRMDEVIFEEFKGTGNMELHLDRGLVERRIFPAINIDRSGTRKEELIYHPDELQKIYGLRRAMQGLGPIESMEMLIQRLKKTKSNAEFLLSLR